MSEIKNKIRQAIEQYIAGEHPLGEGAGGSGHLGHVSSRIDEFSYTEKENGYLVTFKYTILTETEFTYYPDNPPYEDRYEASINLDREFRLVRD